MKNLLLLFVLCYSLQFTSCKTSGRASGVANYPRYAELHHGNYGEGMYSASTPHRQAMERILYAYSDTAKPDRRVPITPVKPVISAAVVAIVQ